MSVYYLRRLCHWDNHTHHLRTASTERFIVCPRLEGFQVLIQKPERKLKATECQGHGGLFEWCEGPVQIHGNEVGQVGDLRVRGDFVGELDQLGQVLLGVAGTEVKARRLQHEPLQADDTADVGLKYLKDVSVCCV